MTDRTHPDSGSTHIIRYALEMGLLWIDGDGRDKVREALDALDTLEAQLEAIGAGGVSGPLMGIAAPPTAQAADSVQEDAAREAIEKVLALFPFNALIQKFSVNNGPCLTADNDDEFYSVKRVLAFLTEIKTTLDAARKQGEKHDL